MKKTYIIPALQVAYITNELPIAASNRNKISSDGNSVSFDPNSMGGSDGSDAVKRNDYDVWDDDWSR